MVLNFVLSHSPQCKSQKITRGLDVLAPLPCHNFGFEGLAKGHKQMPDPGEIAPKLGPCRFSSGQY